MGGREWEEVYGRRGEGNERRGMGGGDREVRMMISRMISRMRSLMKMTAKDEERRMRIASYKMEGGYHGLLRSMTMCQ